MGSQRNGGGGGKQDTDLISVVLTVGTAKALLQALTNNTPPSAPVKRDVSLALARAIGSGSGGGGKKSGGGGKASAIARGRGSRTVAGRSKLS
jgi:hypothetical protein